MKTNALTFYPIAKNSAKFPNPGSLFHMNKGYDIVVETSAFEYKQDPRGHKIIKENGVDREVFNIRIPVSALPQWVNSNKMYSQWRPILRQAGDQVIVTGFTNPKFQAFEVQVGANAYTGADGKVHVIMNGAYEAIVQENSGLDMDKGYAQIVSSIVLPIVLDTNGDHYIAMFPEIRSVVRSHLTGKWGLHRSKQIDDGTYEWDTSSLSIENPVVCFGVPYGFVENVRSNAEGALQELNTELGLPPSEITLLSEPISELTGDRAWEAAPSLVYVALMKSKGSIAKAQQKLSVGEMIGKPVLVRIDQADPGMDAWICAALWKYAQRNNLISSKPLK